MNNTTETLRYVLKFNEGHMVPKHESVAKDIVKTCMYVFIIILILGFIINKEFLFSEMSLTAKISFFAAIGYLWKTRGYERKPSPCELRFYDDYLVFFRPRIYYTKRNIRQEYYKYFYKDIKVCEYRTKVKKINLYGVYEGILYKYKKDGTLNTSPSYHRTVDSICNFYTVFEPDIDFVKIIETYTPIKIEFSES